MSEAYEIAPSDFMEDWVLVVKAGERTQHFRTREEAERYIAIPTVRERAARTAAP